MSRIRGKDTTPEKIVRSLLHRMGYRVRLHVRIPVHRSAAVSKTSRRVLQMQSVPKAKASLAVPSAAAGLRHSRAPIQMRTTRAVSVEIAFDYFAERLAVAFTG